MKVPWIRNRFVLNGLRLIALAVLLAFSGVIAGMALGVPLGRINFASSKAVRLDHARLVGTIDPEVAVATSADLPVGWKAGDAAVAAFGILGSEFCGEPVDMPTALTGVKASVFSSPSGEATLITQAVRVEQWQSAREYVRSVDGVISDCSKFFQTGPDGKRLRIDVKDGQKDAPITDFVSRTFVSEDGSGVQTWSIMAVGDVILGIRHIGKTAPQHSFMQDLQDHILMRIVPQTFAPGGDPDYDRADVTTTSAPGAGSSTTTVIEGGSADESPGGPSEGTGGETRDDGTPTGGASGDEPRD